jgi:hypothetical protein
MGYGSDFNCFEDFTPSIAFLEGVVPERLALAQALARRYITPRGGLFYDPSYGLDLRKFVSETYRPGDVEAMISAEGRKDERVANVVARITVAGETWTIIVNVTTVQGDSFPLTLSVTSVTVELLSVGTVT